jgi:hypothetical protein
MEKLTKKFISIWWIPICYDVKRECGKRWQKYAHINSRNNFLQFPMHIQNQSE